MKKVLKLDHRDLGQLFAFLNADGHDEDELCGFEGYVVFWVVEQECRCARFADVLLGSPNSGAVFSYYDAGDGWVVDLISTDAPDIQRVITKKPVGTSPSYSCSFPTIKLCVRGRDSFSDDRRMLCTSPEWRLIEKAVAAYNKYDFLDEDLLR